MSATFLVLQRRFVLMLLLEKFFSLPVYFEPEIKIIYRGGE